MLGGVYTFGWTSDFNLDDTTFTRPYIRRLTTSTQGTLPFTSEDTNGKMFYVIGFVLDNNGGCAQLAYNPYKKEWISRIAQNNSWYQWGQY